MEKIKSHSYGNIKSYSNKKLLLFSITCYCALEIQFSNLSITCIIIFGIQFLWIDTNILSCKVPSHSTRTNHEPHVPVLDFGIGEVCHIGVGLA